MTWKIYFLKSDFVLLKLKTTADSTSGTFNECILKISNAVYNNSFCVGFVSQKVSRRFRNFVSIVRVEIPYDASKFLWCVWLRAVVGVLFIFVFPFCNGNEFHIFGIFLAHKKIVSYYMEIVSRDAYIFCVEK